MADDIYNNQNITLEDRKKLTITNVTDVESFDEGSITLITSLGTLLIRGTDIKIEKLNLDMREVTATGEFYILEYVSDENTKRSFLSKMFK